MEHSRRNSPHASPTVWVDKLVFQLTTFLTWLWVAMASWLNIHSTLTLGQNTYTIRRKLAEGGYSLVYLASSTPGSGSPSVVLKLIRDVSAWQKERDVLVALPKSPWLVECLDMGVVSTAMGNGAGTSIPQGLLVFPFYERGTLMDVIRGPVSNAEIVSIGLDICHGLNVFHQHNYAFRDLKPGNILVSENNSELKAVLTDCGSAESPLNQTITSRRQGLALAELWAQTITAPYRAPECFDPRADSSVTAASDIWSFGCCLYYLVYKKDCFDGTLTCALSTVGLTQNDDLDAVIRECLRIEPAQRPSLDKLIQKLESVHKIAVAVNGSAPISKNPFLI